MFDLIGGIRLPAVTFGLVQIMHRLGDVGGDFNLVLERRLNNGEAQMTIVAL